MSTILVTGDAGFIGSHLTRELQECGHVVIGHDLEEGDLTQPGVFSTHLAALERHFGGVDRVVHLAAQVGRIFGEQDIPHTVGSNATMTALIARECSDRGIPVLYASSSEVYGDPGEYIATEDGRMNLPHNLYGLSKRWGEEVLRMYCGSENVKVCRLSMPYGPGAPPGRGRRAMDNFLWQAYHGMPITVHRGAERSWCHVRDTVRGIRMVMEFGTGAYNVGRDDHPLSMFDLALWACKLTGASPNLIRLVDPPAMQTVVKRLSTDRLRGLGWGPTIELDEGLPELLEWVKGFDVDGNRISEEVAA